MEKRSFIKSIEETGKLQKLALSRNAPYKIVIRAKIILMVDAGKPNIRIAKELCISRPTVILWRKRYEVSGIEGILKDKKRSGRNRKITLEKIKEIVETTLNTKPRIATHWSTRTMAKEKGVGKTTVWRIWKSHNLKPHRIENFKFSNDPNFVEKLRDVVGLI